MENYSAIMPDYISHQNTVNILPTVKFLISEICREMSLAACDGTSALVNVSHSTAFVKFSL